MVKVKKKDMACLLGQWLFNYKNYIHALISSSLASIKFISSRKQKVRVTTNKV